MKSGEPNMRSLDIPRFRAIEQVDAHLRPEREGIQELPPQKKRGAAPNRRPLARSRQRRLRVIVSDDFALRRNRVVQFLEDQHVRVVGQTVTAEAAVLLAGELRPDVVIMDVRMPGQVDGISATRQLRDSVPGCRVVGFSMAADRNTEARMRAAGAAAYVHKGDPIQSLRQAVRICDV